MAVVGGPLVSGNEAAPQNYNHLLLKHINVAFNSRLLWLHVANN